MAANLIGGAALGAVFGELLRTVVEASRTTAMFRDTLKELQSTLLSIEPVIKEIESFNKVSDKEHETKQLLEIIDKGQKLVTRCCKIHRLDFIKKTYYVKKLHELNRSLDRLYQIMQAQLVRDVSDVDSFKVPEPRDVGSFKVPEPRDVGSFKVPEPRGEMGFQSLLYLLLEDLGKQHWLNSYVKMQRSKKNLKTTSSMSLFQRHQTWSSYCRDYSMLWIIVEYLNFKVRRMV
ncbi:hypothetical protein F3Y22_tig00117034pilonHSYRG00868 [Hibiscus syriacus]|uniref:RPW8 domain-containing protein n=1 Tax=Hibiscus syriacus TaxID=106335 RepID=A0A6A2XF61_HIBSY|nr:hypothetical protein F3Y22_tig00117034pilonHSYRG00868 [Hibiscus syriacus]